MRLCFEDLETISREAAEAVAEAVRTGPRPFRLGLSGGSTPRRTYELLAGLELDWSDVTLVLVDERFVPPDDPASNAGMVQRALADQVCPPAQFVTPDTVDIDPAESASEYGAKLRGFGSLDLVLLGMGVDGHTASLFPGTNDLRSDGAWARVTHSPAGVPQRISLTIDAFEHARRAIVLVDGIEKRERLRQAWDEPDAMLPISVVADCVDSSDWFVTRSAWPH